MKIIRSEGVFLRVGYSGKKFLTVKKRIMSQNKCINIVHKVG